MAQATTFSNENLADDPTHLDGLSTPEEIAEIINCGHSKKSAGPDKISNFVLKKMPHAVMILLAIVFNNCINNCYFPTKWKTAKIVAIPKKSNNNNVAGYRPISLLCSVSKILEELVLRRLKQITITLNILPDIQFGFREKHSTLHPLMKFHHDVTKALNNHQVTVACFLDVEKAFDSVWIEGLIHKLSQLNFPIGTIKMIYSFLHSRSFYVQVGDSQSGTKSIRAGVAQGSKLGPMLYSIFTSDQPRLEGTTQGCLFADDSATYCSSMSPALAATRVQSHIQKIFSYYKRWGIRINTNKSELICIRRPITGRTRGRSVANCRGVKINLPDGSTISTSNDVKYLGVHFNEKFRFNPHSKTVIKKAAFAFHRVYPLMRKQNGLSTRTKLLLYKQLIRPIITYAFPVWYTISKTYLKKLAIFERKMLRVCTGLRYDPIRRRHVRSSQLYEEAKVKPLERYMVELYQKMLGNISTHPNSLVRQISEDQIIPEHRYLEVMALLNEATFPRDSDTTSYPFYDNVNSSHHRG